MNAWFELNRVCIGNLEPAMADFVHAVLSRLFGKMSGWRARGDRRARFIAGIALADPNGLEKLCPEIEPLGWPDTKQALRRLGLAPDDIDELWSRSLLIEGEERLGRLPLELLTYLFPPELWKALALIIEEGPYPTGRRFERWMRLVARGEGPCGSRLGENTLKGMQTEFRSLLRHIQWLAQSDPGLSGIAACWADLPSPLDLRAHPSPRTTDAGREETH